MSEPQETTPEKDLANLEACVGNLGIDADFAVTWWQARWDRVSAIAWQDRLADDPTPSPEMVDLKKIIQLAITAAEQAAREEERAACAGIVEKLTRQFSATITDAIRVSGQS